MLKCNLSNSILLQGLLFNLKNTCFCYIHLKSSSLPTFTQKPSGVLKHSGFVRTPAVPNSSEHISVYVNSSPKRCPVCRLHDGIWSPWLESWLATYQLCELREAFFFFKPHVPQL